MIKGRPFLFQPAEGTVYHVAEKGVEMVQSWSPKGAIVAFVNGDGFKPEHTIRRPSVQLIVASSPKRTYSDWAKRLGPGSFVAQIAVKLWSPKELFLTGLVLILRPSRGSRLCRIFLSPSDLPFKLLRDSTSYFGFNPRRCFEASSSVILKTKVRELENAIHKAAEDWRIMELLLSARTGGTQTGVSNVSHKVFQIVPPDTDPNRWLFSCHFEAVSEWAFEVLLKKYEALDANAVAEFYLKLSGMPDSALLRGHLFERQVLNHLHGICTPLEFSIRGLTNSNEMKWTYHGPIRHVTLQESSFFSELTKAVENQERLHLVPLARNLPSVDSISILYDPNDPYAVVTCIQITNVEHPISVSGLRLIQGWLKLDAPLRNLRPCTNKPWRFVFVVPFGADKFKLQQFVDDSTRGAKRGVGDWPRKVQQFVLGLEEDSIFARRSKSNATSSQYGVQQVQC